MFVHEREQIVYTWYNSHINVGNIDDLDNILGVLMLATVLTQGTFILATAPRHKSPLTDRKTET